MQSHYYYVILVAIFVIFVICNQNKNNEAELKKTVEVKKGTETIVTAPKEAVGVAKGTAGVAKGTAKVAKDTAGVVKGIVGTPKGTEGAIKAAAPKGTVAAPKGTEGPPKGVGATPKAAAPKGTLAAPEATEGPPKGTVAAPKGTKGAPKQAAPAPKTAGPITMLMVNQSLCYVHVGKSGGASIARALGRIHNIGGIGNWIQVHSLTKVNQKKFETTGQCRSPRPLPSSGFDCPSNWEHPYYPDIPEYCESCHACNNTGFVLLWARDPVSRLISTWNFDWDHRYFLTELAKNKYNISLEDAGIPFNPYNMTDEWSIDTVKSRYPHILDGNNHTEIVDLNTAIETIADLKPSRDAVFRGLEFFKKVPHTINSLAYYLGGKKAQRTRPDNTCMEVVKTLNIGFVGRTEYMANDWEQFQRSALGLGKEGNPGLINIGHSHGTGKTGRFLSQKAVQFLRDMYKEEINCFAELVSLGYLDQSYFEEINSSSKEYMY